LTAFEGGENTTSRDSEGYERANCGVLSQIINHMVASELAGLSPGSEVPIPDPEFDLPEGPGDEAPLPRYPGVLESEDRVAAFTLELMRTGHMLSNLGADLVESLPDDEYPGESPAAVVIEMVVGTIRTSLADADEGELERATELIVDARERVLEHLQLALALSRRMNESSEDEPRCGFG
jgi:hypothetical protein